MAESGPVGYPVRDSPTREKQTMAANPIEMQKALAGVTYPCAGAIWWSTPGPTVPTTRC